MTNNITTNGALGRDAELRFTQSGKAVLNLSLADGRSRKNDRGEWEEVRPTIWHNVSVWGALAEMWANSNLLVKGAKVDVTGELTIREYEHQGEKRWQTEIRAHQIGVRESTNAAPRPSTPAADPWSTGGDDSRPPF